MKTFDEAGIGPRVWYTSIEDKLSITNFIEAEPFPVTPAKEKLPDLLCKLHSLDLFPREIHSLDTANRYIKIF